MKYRDNAKYQIVMNIIWSLFSFLLSYGINFFMTPYLAEKVGIDAYGFISLANTFISYIDIISVAINAFAARYIAIAYHNQDYDQAEEFYSSVFMANLCLALLIDIPLALMIVKLDIFLNIPKFLTTDIKVLFVIILLNYTLSLFATIFSLGAFIKNHASATSRNSSVSRLVYVIMLGLMIYFTEVKVYYMAMANAFASLFMLFANIHCSNKYMPEIHIVPKKASMKKVKQLISSGIWNSINNIGNMLNSGLDLLITNQLLSSVLMGNISVAKQLANMITSLSFLISNAFQAKQLEAYAKNEKKELIGYLKMAMKCMGIFGGLIFAIFFALGRQFLDTWLPGQDTELIYKLSVIVLIGDVVVVVVRPLFYVNTLTDKLKVVCWITIASGCINVMAMFILIKYYGMGAYAIVLTTMILNLIVHCVITPRLIAYFLKLEERNIFSKVVTKHLVVTIISTLILRLISKILPTYSTWECFICNMIILSILGIVLMVIGELNKEEQLTLLYIIREKVCKIAK